MEGRPVMLEASSEREKILTLSLASNGRRKGGTAGREEGQYGARFTDTRGEDVEKRQTRVSQSYHTTQIRRSRSKLWSVLRDKNLVMYIHCLPHGC